ncbi:hypothetical protein HNR12_001424 [Streptomonospora nanhaiensis]|uniref:Uncharacterized protein n=1 Tax=Streptomonospora nanhaiensis TaxID=1323731 RepID=A0A853BKH0_9ACTN|nr:hypothetical protein [Streptomonospora nanhaiensis]NYI95147.1 hypothetical protein [Streptomonospora nanhaiensis]
MRAATGPARLRSGFPLVLAAVAVAASGCTLYSTSTVDIVSSANPRGAACTALVVTRAGAEIEGSADCEVPPADHEPVHEDRRAVPVAVPDLSTDQRRAELVTTTDAHGRACTLVATVLVGGVDETSIDCDYPPPGVRPGSPTQQQPPDPDTRSDWERVAVATFADTHGRTCVTSTAAGGASTEIDITCEYTEREPPERPTEAPLPG